MKHRGGRGDRAACARGAVGGRGPRLRWRRGAGLRAGLADPEPVRSAADPADRAGGRQGSDGLRRRDPADQGFRRIYARCSSASCSAPGFVMKPVFAKAKTQPMRVDLCRGRGRAGAARDPGRARGEPGAADPGRPSRRWSRRGSSGSGSRSRRASDFELINPEDDPRYRSYVQSYIEVAGRRGVTPDAARTVVRTNSTVIAALAVIARRGGRHDLRRRGPLHEPSAPRP